MCNLDLKLFEAVCDAYDESVGFRSSLLPECVEFIGYYNWRNEITFKYQGFTYEVKRTTNGFTCKSLVGSKKYSTLV